jgi:hypothetical protein
MFRAATKRPTQAGLFPAVSLCCKNLPERAASLTFFERTRTFLFPAVASEAELQRELDQPRIVNVQHLAECAARV